MTKTSSVTHSLLCPVVFLITEYGGRRDIMTATAMFASETQPLVAVSVAKGHLTDDLIDRSGEFTLAVASDAQKDLALKVGSARGDDEDKFERFSVETLSEDAGKRPIPKGSSVCMECKVESRQDIGEYHMIIGRVENLKDLGGQPLVWYRDLFYRLQAL
jgi:flavin reductase (DIM6/NTAB) family NADH-FMN oxidoreductase RutF